MDDHPSPEQLQKFLAGELEEPWRQRISLHVDLCPICAEQLDRDLQERLKRNAPTPKTLPSGQTIDFQPGSEPPVPEKGPGSPADFAGRFRFLEKLGEGGIGVVWRVHEAGLNRHLALKMLREKLRSRSDLVRRFIIEAQVTAQLQHPAIVPVHEMGNLPDGSPFYTMKLVRGRTLAELLPERWATDLPRFLGVFEQVCQALAYAHAHRVIHRDLKPANVMVGEFGEVQVMDWGMAKVLGPPTGARPEEGQDAPATTVAETVPPVAETPTQEGRVLGTYQYMAPEQARAMREEIDERSDVFGLGAILCEILTGQPPYTGTRAEIVEQSQLGHLQPAYRRLEECRADEELVRLAKGCLSAQAEARPPDAGAVAAAIRAYLSGVQEQLRQAELEQAKAYARAGLEQKAREAAEAKAAAQQKAKEEAAAKAAVHQPPAKEENAANPWLANWRRDLAAVFACLLLVGGIIYSNLYPRQEAGIQGGPRSETLLTAPVTPLLPPVVPQGPQKALDQIPPGPLVPDMLRPPLDKAGPFPPFVFEPFKQMKRAEEERRAFLGASTVGLMASPLADGPFAAAPALFARKMVDQMPPVPPLVPDIQRPPFDEAPPSLSGRPVKKD